MGWDGVGWGGMGWGRRNNWSSNHQTVALTAQRLRREVVDALNWCQRCNLVYIL